MNSPQQSTWLACLPSVRNTFEISLIQYWENEKVAWLFNNSLLLAWKISIWNLNFYFSSNTDIGAKYATTLFIRDVSK